MKFNKSSQLLLVSAASLLAASLVTACGTLTTDFVFVTSSKAAGTNNYGQVDVFEINQESGVMRQIPTSPFPSGGRDPVAEAVSTDQTNLYVVNEDDNSIVQFVIGNDGKVYPQNTVNTPGIFPVAVAVNGTNLYVLDTYQPLPICSTAAPCSGSIAVLPITVGSGSPPSDSLGTPVANGALTYWPLCQYGYVSATNFTECNPGATNDVITPTAVNVLGSGAFVYVAAYDSTASPGAGYVFAFATSSSGALVPLNGGVPYPAGNHPSAIASDSTSSYLYVTDFNNSDVLGYSVASGGLAPLTNGAGGTNRFAAGDQPTAIVADPKYPYLYVANSLDSTVTAYSVSSGALTALGTYATGTQPVAIGIDPSANHFLYSANYLGNGVSGTVSGFELSPTDGTLLNSQNSPYTSNAQPTAVTAIPHGVSQMGSSSSK
ncbi:MAG TPA: beta-propeller fold lactonase family protein [Terracidiphilus sp.]